MFKFLLVSLATFAVFQERECAAKPPKSVVIVGAGAAGLGAAAQLVQSHGYSPAQITILEAENRIGGRIHTTKFGSAVVEIGAQWVHGDDNIVYGLAALEGLLHTEFQTQESTGYASNVVAAYTGSGKKITRAQWKLFQDVTEDIYSSSIQDLFDVSNISLGDYFNQKFPKYLTNGWLDCVDNATAIDLLDWYHRAECVDTAAPSWFNISGLGFANYPDYEGDDMITWKDGYSSLFSVLLGQEYESLMSRVVFNATVSSVQWNPDATMAPQVQVTTTSGQVYKADVVLVTVSLGVLKEKAATLFTPNLPAFKTKAIVGLGFGTVDKIFLKFQNPWWNRVYWGGVNFITSSANRTGDWSSNVLGFYTVRDQPNLLVGWISGPAAMQMETLADSVLLEGCSKLLKEALGSEFSNYTEPVGIIRSSWYTNSNFRGSYSYRSTESDQLDVWPDDLAQPLQDSNNINRLFFAGEATHSSVYSTVHAAVETGVKQADLIAQSPY